MKALARLFLEGVVMSIKKDGPCSFRIETVVLVPGHLSEHKRVTWRKVWEGP